MHVARLSRAPWPVDPLSQPRRLPFINRPPLPEADPPARSESGRYTNHAGLVVGAASFLTAVLAAILASGLLPSRSSGEGMLLFIFVSLPLALLALRFSLGSRRSTGQRRRIETLGITFALIALLAVALALLVVYIGWSLCAPSCI